MKNCTRCENCYYCESIERVWDPRYKIDVIDCSCPDKKDESAKNCKHFKKWYRGENAIRLHKYILGF